MMFASFIAKRNDSDKQQTQINIKRFAKLRIDTN